MSFHQEHSLAQCLGETAQTIKINTTCNTLASVVLSVPDYAVVSGVLFRVDQSSYQLAPDIVNVKAHWTRRGQLVGDRRARIEGIGVVLHQVKE